MDTSIFIQPIANLYQWNDVIDRNLAYVKQELPALPIPAEIRSEISTVCDTFQWTLSDVRKEIRNLEDKLGMHPGEEPCDPNIVNPDPQVTIGFIQRWILEELSALHDLVQKLDKLAAQDSHAYDPVSLLVKESFANILKAYLGAQADLKFIAVQSVNKRPKNLQSFLARFLPDQTEKVSEKNFEDLQDFGIWQQVCEQILARPFPPQNSDFSDDKPSYSDILLSKFSNWEIICQEILDTQFHHTYYQRCLEELRRRGKSEAEIFEMRRIAWYTVGWLNFPMMVWDWVHLDESDIFRAIEWLYDKKQISQEKRIEFENFVTSHAG